MSVCEKCNTALNHPNTTITCKTCSRKFHGACCGFRKNSNATAKTQWQCSSCDTVAPATKPDIALCDMLEAIRREFNNKLDELVDKYSGMDANYKSLSESYDKLNMTLETFKHQLDAQNCEIAELKKEKKDITDELNAIKQDLADLQQYTRRNNIEVHGVPVTPKEDVYAVVEAIAGAIGVEYNRRDISIAHRLGSSRKDGPSGIVIACVSRTTKNAWIAAARRRKRMSGSPLCARDLSSSLPETPIYINEHLTAANKQLLGAARAAKRSGAISFAWPSDGKILVRQHADSNVIRITQVSDLNQFS